MFTSHFPKGMVSLQISRENSIRNTLGAWSKAEGPIEGRIERYHRYRIVLERLLKARKCNHSLFFKASLSGRYIFCKNCPESWTIPQHVTWKETDGLITSWRYA